MKAALDIIEASPNFDIITEKGTRARRKQVIYIKPLVLIPKSGKVAKHKIIIMAFPLR